MSDIEIIAHVEAWSAIPNEMPMSHLLYEYDRNKGWFYLTNKGYELYQQNKSEVDYIINAVHRPAIQKWAEGAAKQVLS